jgi:hypothetical protein
LTFYLLLDAGHRMRQAQAGLLKGNGLDAFASARKAEQTVVATLAKQARSLLEERGNATTSTLDQVSQSLRAAAVSDEGRARLATRRFEKALRRRRWFRGTGRPRAAQQPSQAPPDEKIVTGPSFTSSTCILAPKTPVSTWRPCSRRAAQNRS